MNLFVFGCGYTTLEFIGASRGRFSRICGTFRSDQNARALRDHGVIPYFFDSGNHDPRIRDEIRTTDILLVSIPTVSGIDAVLQSFSVLLMRSPRLRWIGYLSTVGVYGNADGAWVDETTPPNPVNERSQHRVSVENQWLDLGMRASFTVQIFRLAGVYGPGRNALLRVSDGTARRIIKPGQVFNRIHTADIARTLTASIDQPISGAIYNVADNEPSPPQSVIDYAARLLGRAPPPETPFDQAELGSMARTFYRDNKRVCNLRIREELGVSLLYPTYRDGLDALFASGEGVSTSGTVLITR
jgi:hypothetical protein